mgnify:CR=1 FL=1
MGKSNEACNLFLIFGFGCPYICAKILKSSDYCIKAYAHQKTRKELLFNLVPSLSSYMEYPGRSDSTKHGDFFIRIEEVENLKKTLTFYLHGAYSFSCGKKSALQERSIQFLALQTFYCNFYCITRNLTEKVCNAKNRMECSCNADFFPQLFLQVNE